jgi:hypothetical protein
MKKDDIEILADREEVNDKQNVQMSEGADVREKQNANNLEMQNELDGNVMDIDDAIGDLELLLDSKTPDDKQKTQIVTKANTISKNLHAAYLEIQKLLDSSAKNDNIYDVANCYRLLGKTSTKLSWPKTEARYSEYMAICVSAFESAFDILRKAPNTPKYNRQKLLFKICLAGHKRTSDERKLVWSNRIMTRLAESHSWVTAEKLSDILCERVILLREQQPHQFLDRLDLIIKFIKFANLKNIPLSNNSFKVMCTELSELFPSSKIIPSAASFCAHLETEAWERAKNIYSILNMTLETLLKDNGRDMQLEKSIVLDLCKLVCNDAIFRNNIYKTLLQDFESKIKRLADDAETFRILSANYSDAALSHLTSQQNSRFLQSLQVGDSGEIGKMLQEVQKFQLAMQAIPIDPSNKAVSTVTAAITLESQESKKQGLGIGEQQNTPLTLTGTPSNAELIAREVKKRKCGEKEEQEKKSLEPSNSTTSGMENK